MSFNNTLKLIVKKKIEVIFYASLLMPICIILSIDLGVIPLIKININSDTCIKINMILSNLSYSYIAGSIFYLLTVVLPYSIKLNDIKPAINRNVHKIRNSIENILLEYSRGTNLNHSDFSEENVKQILSSKNWTDNMAFLNKLYGISITYVKYINEEYKVIDKMVNETISNYKGYLTEKQIILLEDIRYMQIRRSASLFSSLPRVNLEDPKGKKFLIEEFFKLVKKYLEIENEFK
jgi:hypothetical protein